MTTINEEEEMKLTEKAQGGEWNGLRPFPMEQMQKDWYGCYQAE